MKLYLVRCRGMVNNFVGPYHGEAYVVANNPDEAYRMLRHYLDEQNIGFRYDRELSSVKLLADSSAYPDCRVRLYIAGDLGEPETELEKLQAFWEWSRMTDKMKFEAEYNRIKEGKDGDDTEAY